MAAVPRNRFANVLWPTCNRFAAAAHQKPIKAAENRSHERKQVRCYSPRFAFIRVSSPQSGRQDLFGLDTRFSRGLQPICSRSVRRVHTRRLAMHARCTSYRVWWRSRRRPGGAPGHRSVEAGFRRPPRSYAGLRTSMLVSLAPRTCRLARRAGGSRRCWAVMRRPARGLR